MDAPHFDDPALTGTTVPGLWTVRVLVDERAYGLMRILTENGMNPAMALHLVALWNMGVDGEKLLRSVARMKRGRPRAPKVASAAGIAKNRTKLKLNDVTLAALDGYLHASARSADTSERERIRHMLERLAAMYGMTLRKYARLQPAHRDAPALTPSTLVAKVQVRLSRWRRKHSALQK